ncbi:hypothetical protein GCM10023200_24380 [Actinomycetospora chlora]|uniref:Uncharacterized protein n=1 Tax=Actinomycetospora chlora TaxID=663608 RepID=A0ABP9B0K0_9PSEU
MPTGLDLQTPDGDALGVDPVRVREFVRRTLETADPSSSPPAPQRAPVLVSAGAGLARPAAGPPPGAVVGSVGAVVSVTAPPPATGGTPPCVD